VATIKTLDNFKIVLKDGTTYDMADDFSVLVRSFSVSSPQPIISRERIEGRNGEIRLGKDYGPRRISAVCSFFAVDYEDLALLRTDLFRTLMAEDEFYVVSDAQLNKRWLVEVASEFTPEKIGNYGAFTLDFVSASAYTESVGTTLDGFTFDSEKWGFGGGLVAEDVKYTHTTATFSIYNASDVTVDPRVLPLKITYTGASTNLSIKNNTTNETWSYTGSTVAGNTLVIDGTRSLKNGVSVFANTNRKLITLKPGWNDFTLTGASGSFTVAFDFRFYYL
jgi:phage-related protein